MFIGSVSSLLKFGSQTSKSVQDIRKVCFEMTLCVLAYFVEFYVFVLDEIDMGGPKIVFDHFCVGNV